MKKLIPLTVALSLIFITTSALAKTPRGTERNQMRAGEMNPCRTLRGQQLNMCFRNARRVTEEPEKRVVPFGERRIQALRSGQRRQRSVLVPRLSGRWETINLAPRNHTRARTLRGMMVPADQSTQAQSLLRTRAKAGRNRDGSTSLPLCNRRDGMRLINCMLSFGIEITKDTVDRETWEIWLRIREDESIDSANTDR
jgi:hypothetical protein